jgi:hypothetical protein
MQLRDATSTRSSSTSFPRSGRQSQTEDTRYLIGAEIIA